MILSRKGYESLKLGSWKKSPCIVVLYQILNLDLAFKLASVFFIKISFSKKINTNLIHLKYKYCGGRSNVTNNFTSDNLKWFHDQIWD